MSDKFTQWFAEKMKEASLHRALGAVEGYRKAIQDVRADLFGKPVTLGEADAILAHLDRTAAQLQQDTLVEKTPKPRVPE